MGPPTQAQVTERALEIAEIEGRPGRATPDDYERAREEVRGMTDEAGNVPGDRPDSAEARDYAEEHRESTQTRANIDARDESEDLNNLVHEGVDEANHEQMLEARREKEDQRLDRDETEGDFK